MTSISALCITPQPTPDQDISRFDLNGSVDVDAGPILSVLGAVNDGGRLILDFTRVQRVNSMGLAQLLKVFEELKSRKVRIEVQNMNRMVNMLFKMTGMDRFLGEGAAKAAPESMRAPAAAAPDPDPTMPAAENTGERLNFMVSLQSSQQLSGWYFMNTYLQRQLGRPIRFEPVHGSLGQSGTMLKGNPDIVFAKPFDACALMQQRGFVPLLRPKAMVDEICIASRANDPRQSLADFKSARVVVAASSDSFIYLLGRFLLDESGVDSSGLEFVFAGTEVKATRMLIEEKADMLIMLSEAYRNLSGLVRSMTRLLDETDSCYAFPLLCCSPQLKSLHAGLKQVFCGMEDDPRGRLVLQDTLLTGWVDPMEDEIRMLLMLFNRYSTAECLEE